MDKIAVTTRAMYARWRRVRMMPKLPMFLAMTLSSSEFRPNRLDWRTSLRHLPHLCTPYLVRPTRKGIISMLMMPKNKMASTASK